MKLNKQDEEERKREILRDPVLWAKYFVKLPDGNFFAPSFIQKKVFNAKSKRVVISVHRRAGKTICLAMLALWVMFTHPAAKILFIAPGEPQIEKFYQVLDELLGCNPTLNACVGKRSNSPYRRSIIQGNGRESYIWGFVAQKGSTNIRGQEADYILIDECDFIEDTSWASISPVIDGDKFRKVKPKLYAASTPGDDPDSMFMSWIANEENDPDTDIIFVPITENEDYTKEEIQEIEDRHRRENRTIEFEREYLLKIGLSSDKNVFKAQQIERAARLANYIEVSRGQSQPYPETYLALPKKREGEIRIIAVDWDRVQAGPSIILLQYLPKDPFLRVLWREEVDKNKEHLFHWTCQYIIDMWDHIKWDYLMSEATRDTMQIHEFQIIARSEKPHLLSKIIEVDFNANYETLDIKKKETIGRRYKQVIIGNLQNAFENDRIIFPSGDKQLKRQLLRYKVVGHTTRGPSYSKEDEHFIDALGMAAWAFFDFYDNPFKTIPASKPVAVPRKIDEEEFRQTTRSQIPATFRGFTGSSLRNRAWSNKPIRSRF